MTDLAQAGSAGHVEKVPLPAVALESASFGLLLDLEPLLTNCGAFISTCVRKMLPFGMPVNGIIKVQVAQGHTGSRALPLSRILNFNCSLQQRSAVSVKLSLGNP
jgi:hypothetical protein